MPKIAITLILSVFLATAFSSCLLTYDCECVTTDNGEVIHTATDPYAGPRKSAQNTCDDFEKDVNSIGSTPTRNTECTLK